MTSYNAMVSTDLDSAQLIFSQVAADIQQQRAEEWAIMEATTTKIFVIDTTQSTKPTSWVLPGLLNNTTRVPCCFPPLMALRIKWMLNNLPG